MQLSIPVYNDPHYTALSNTLNNFLPSFWINVHVDMNTDARNYIHFITRVLPQIILGVGIGNHSTWSLEPHQNSFRYSIFGWYWSALTACLHNME